MALRHMQIGEVAQLTGLSLRTIRYYEEMALVRPSARSTGGFRLYTETDVARLRLVRRMKPLDLSLEEMRDVLDILDTLERPDLPAPERAAQVDRLELCHSMARARVESVRQQLEIAEGFADDLRLELRRQRRVASRS